MTEALPSRGYSGTPLPRKLGLRDGQRALFVALPQSLDRLRDAAAFVAADVADEFGPIAAGPYDIVHAFFTGKADLQAAVPHLMDAIEPDGAIWISWPKKSSKRPTDISEDTIREIVLPLGLVDVKVCAVDDIWSGLKLVIRRELRPRKR